MQGLDTLPLGHEQLRQGQRAHAGRPESLEGLSVLAPGVQQDVKSRAAVNVEGLDKVQNGVALIADEECEGHYETLWCQERYISCNEKQ